jgi:uncharacterized membrane protein YqiK
MISVTAFNDQRAWVAPSAWAFVAGVVVIVLVLVLAVPAGVRAIGVGIGGALIVYFTFKYATAARRGEIPDRNDDDPPGGWSTQGPYS